MAADDGESDGLYVEEGRKERVVSGGRVLMGLGACFENEVGEVGERGCRWCFAVGDVGGCGLALEGLLCPWTDEKNAEAPAKLSRLGENEGEEEKKKEEDGAEGARLLPCPLPPLPPPGATPPRVCGDLSLREVMELTVDCDQRFRFPMPSLI